MNKLLNHCIDSLLHLNNYPVLYKGHNFFLVNFGIFAALDTIFTLSGFFFYAIAKGIDFTNDIAVWMIGLTLSTLIGSKILHPFVVGKDFLSHPIKYIRQTSMYNQGGEIGAIIGISLFSYFNNIQLAILFDAACYGAVLGLIFGRLGCYNYGCCFGNPTHSKFATHYNHANSKVLRIYPELKNVALIPTQLYSALFNILLLIAMTVIANCNGWNGLLSATFLIAYNVFRVIIEKYRFHEGTNLYKYIAQFYTIMGFILLIALIFIPKLQITTPFVIDFGLINFFKLTFLNKEVFPWLIMSSIIAFIYYGVHYKKLGQHF